MCALEEVIHSSFSPLHRYYLDLLDLPSTPKQAPRWCLVVNHKRHKCQKSIYITLDGVKSTLRTIETLHMALAGFSGPCLETVISLLVHQTSCWRHSRLLKREQRIGLPQAMLLITNKLAHRLSQAGPFQARDL